jgi:uncharacterized protein (TIGR03083 family)
MDHSELSAFAAECESVEATLVSVPAEAWAQPALGEWTLAELTAHLIGAAAKIAEYAEQPVPAEAQPVCDRVGYWRFELSAEAPAIAARARERAASLEVGSMAVAFSTAWRASANTVLERGLDSLISTLRGPMQLREYLATRVLEVCVHHMDVRAALDQPPAATPEAGRITMAILEGLLGDRRPRNYGRTRFILAATGRTSSDDPRFPVLV